MKKDKREKIKMLFTLVWCYYFGLLAEEWDAISQQCVIKLLASMRRWCQSVVLCTVLPHATVGPVC